jgi:hypothetical protein
MSRTLWWRVLLSVFGLALILVYYDEIEPRITFEIGELKYRVGQKIAPMLATVDRSLNCRKVSETIFEGDGYRWQLLTANAAYTPRDGATAVRHNSRVFMIGGWAGSNVEPMPRRTTNEVWSTLDGRDWSRVKPNTFDANFESRNLPDFPGRHRSPIVSFKGYMYLLGGDANQGYHQTDIWRSKDGKAWEKVADNAPWGPRVFHMAAVLGESIYVFGGQTLPFFTHKNETVNESYYNDAWKSDDGVNWERVPQKGLRWAPRGGIGGDAFVFKGKVYIVGGFNYEKPNPSRHIAFSDVWSSSNMQSWQLLTAHAEFEKADNGLIFHDISLFDNQLWIVGGMRLYGDTNEVWRSHDGKKWRRLSCSAIRPSHASTVVSVEDGIIFAAGHHMTREVWKLSKLPN